MAPHQQYDYKVDDKVFVDVGNRKDFVVLHPTRFSMSTEIVSLLLNVVLLTNIFLFFPCPLTPCARRTLKLHTQLLGISFLYIGFL